MRSPGKSAVIIIAFAVIFVITFSFASSSSSFYGQVEDGNGIDVLKKEVKHIETPEPLKAIYMTACVASMPKYRQTLVDLINKTEINALVIDIKDYSGTVSFDTGNPQIDSIKGGGCRVSDMPEFVKSLHDQDIYVIGRVTVFQDPLYTKIHPELAVKRESDDGVWKDRKGISFIDVGSKPFWDYIVSIATSSYAAGFDEINFDYIRYPSDGDMSNTAFTQTGTFTKREMLKQFFEYLNQKISGTGLVTSADIFGMTTTASDDMGIGQILENALENFDYVSPMVYPSHYPPHFNGWPDPNKVPYEIVKFAMDGAVARSNFLNEEIASTSPSSQLLQRIKPKQLRPWLQDNDYPVHYTADMIRKQIQATYDSGLTSWMLWDPANTYTKEALLPK